MVHWRCRHLHSFATQNVNHRLLQQWRILVLQAAEPLQAARFPVPPFTTRSQQPQGMQRAFSTCSCRGNKRSISSPHQQQQNQQLAKTMTAASAAAPSPPHHDDLKMKRAAKRRIPVHIVEKIDKVILSPQTMSSTMSILSHLETGQKELAWDLFERMTRWENCNATSSRAVVQQLLACLRADIRQGVMTPAHVRRLILLLHHVKTTKTYFDENEFRVVIELLDRLDLVDRAEVVFRTMSLYCDQPPNVRTYNKLAAMYLRRIKALDGRQRHSRYMDKLATLVRSLEKYGIAPDVVTFNILLTARGRLGQVKETEAIFDWMERVSVAPNNRTVNIALDLYGKLNVTCGLERALASVFGDEKGLEGEDADVITYATRIRNAVKRWDMESAEQTLKAMVERGILPNEYVYAHLVMGYVQNGDISKAHTVINLMTKSPNGLQPTAHLYGPIIHAYAQTHDYEKAYSVLSEMLDQGIPTNLTIYTILASMFTDSPIFEEPVQAIRILRSFYKFASKDEPLDQAALTVLIQAHGIAGARDLEFDASWSSLQSRHKTRHQHLNHHDSITHDTDNHHSNHVDNSMTHNAGNHNHLDNSNTTVHSLSRRKLHARAVEESYNAIAEPDDLAYTAILAAYARLKMPEASWRIWTSLKAKSNVDLNTFHYNALIMGLVNDEAWYKTATDVFNEMVAAANTITTTTTSSLPTGNDESGSRNNKPIPDIPTFDLMIYGAYASGDLEAIQRYWRMSLRPKPNEVADPPSLLARTYYYALQAMTITNDTEGVNDIYNEFKSLPSLPASATLWAHKIHDLYRHWSA